MIEIKNESDLKIIENAIKNRQQGFDRYLKDVLTIVNDVKEMGDEALCKYTSRFDNFEATKDNIKVKEEEIETASKEISNEDKEIINCAKERIERFHKAFLPKSCFIEEDGAILGNRITPVKKCGLYIPGGKAAYPSTALMTIIPAVVAGVEDIQIATPSPSGIPNPYVLYIASLFGIKDIYKIGGAQAIAAFAYSTQTVRKVDVIAGPGNIYVALAKRLVFGDVGIDSVAGPSEIMVVADSSAHIEYVAKDLLSQAEHDELAGCFFVGFDKVLTEAVEKRFFELAKNNPRSSITNKSAKNALFVCVDSVELASRVVDIVAPEHLQLHLASPYEFMNRINNAGAIFIGEFTPEPIGDYVAGPNHTLPTSSTARFFSPLSAETFLKKTSIIHFSYEGFKKVAECASKFAALEGLFAHKDAIDERIRSIKTNA
ncbi:histidinol dehydrogenase [Hippea jasoniae]|uniref:histidinol dehydrogenase n=1 Tax=Hippea jasoniae TaxID=944479 RepID=UPI000551EC28|nr:histidinol dehydrogenase [Hippea jasoniae]